MTKYQNQQIFIDEIALKVISCNFTVVLSREESDKLMVQMTLSNEVEPEAGLICWGEINKSKFQ